ncbi:[FeFe] hydrogenase H-cluster radical SAM maturase HydE [Eubacterium oxidoreducens]|nr:[FeFe] hydrogenase H-cluster radical SAM maturase HydE [Eubacterium oxidoreducens]
MEKLKREHRLTKEEWIFLFDNRTRQSDEKLFRMADEVRREHFGNKVYKRGLIEFTNYCRNDCYYCGIRKSNLKVSRYRLSEEEILSCCEEGYRLGFRTFVLQGGEDGAFAKEDMIRIVSAIRSRYPDCAITLSIGEWDKAAYQEFFDAGADRYLLRHETANKEHYESLHPKQMNYERRIECLQALKEIGYQVGCGFMVDSPNQTSETLAEDMMFIQDFRPAMVGIGPFVPHHDTPFKDKQSGTVTDTLFCIALLRLILPFGLIPATTALGTISETGREQGIRCGANVVMPNLSPTIVRKKYELYDHKICTGEEAAECVNCLNARMEAIGYEIVVDRGDSPLWQGEKKA